MKAKTAIFAAVVLLAVAFFATRIDALRADIGTIELQVNWLATTLSLALLLAGFCVMAGIWWLVLRGVGARHAPIDAFNSFALTQFSKYLPGGIWPILGRATLLAGNKPRLLAASTLEAGIKVIAALALSMLLIDTSNQIPAGAAVIVVVTVLVLLRPQVLSPLLGLARRVSGRFELDLSAFSQIHISLAVLLSAGTWVIIGYAYAVFINGFVEAPVVVLIGAFALAWAVGFLVIPAPAGIGVREVVLVVATTPFLTEPLALVLALAARVWWMAGDALFFTLGLLTKRTASQTDP